MPDNNSSQSSRAAAAPAAEPDHVLGAHMATTGGLHRAVVDGVAIGCSTVQLFTSSPQQWKARPVDEEHRRQFREAVKDAGVAPLVVHDSYLINLASADDALREKSVQAFLEELERCEALGIHYLVTHCGACGTETEDQGLARLAGSLSRIHRDTRGYGTHVTMEVTAGQGSCLGFRFQHFRRMLEECEESERLRVCFDTCHAFAAGYDLRTEETYNEVMDEFDRIVGLDRLAVLHLNDSKRERGSRVDRHAHIGQGFLGPEAFRLIMRDERFRKVPKIVETPESETMHAENLKELRRLAAVTEPLPPAAEPAPPPPPARQPRRKKTEAGSSDTVPAETSG